MQMLFPLMSVWLSFVFLRPCGVVSLKQRVRRDLMSPAIADLLLDHVLEYHVYESRYLSASCPYTKVRVTSLLTDEIIEPEQGTGELPLAFHDDPDAGANTPVNELCTILVRNKT